MTFRLLFMLLLALPGWAFSSSMPSADRHLQSMYGFIASAFTNNGLAHFEQISANVENNIFWRGSKKENKYEIAFKHSYPFLTGLQRDDIPPFVFLIPTLESGWNGKLGNPASDYGYWQLMADVVNEIKMLDEASDALRNADINTIRSNPELSTEAALIHLRRYWFYFRHVAKFSEADAWMFSVTAFNWGAGNVKAALAEMMALEAMPAVTFGDFYTYLYRKSEQNPTDRSMRAALEYLPNLWNIARLVQSHHSAEALNISFTLNKSSSVSMP